MVDATPSLGVRTSAHVTKIAPRQPPAKSIHGGGARHAMEMPWAWTVASVMTVSTRVPATNDTAAAAMGEPRARASCALMGPCSAITVPDNMPSSDQTSPIIAILSPFARLRADRCSVSRVGEKLPRCLPPPG